MLESKATSQLGAIAKGSVQDQGQWLSAVVKIKSNCREQLSRSRAIVKRSCHDQEPLSSAVVKIKSHCRAQWSRSRAIVKRKWSLTRSRAERSRSNCRDQEQSSERSRSNRQV